MLVVVDWLQELLSSPIKEHQLLDALEKAGIEVENIHRLNKYDPKIVVGEIQGLRAHPNADNLKLVKVKAGKLHAEVVCGASNLKLGQKVAYAGVGAKLPDGMIIKEASIRGQVSPGMLLSERELRLSGEHSGILELDSSVKAGSPLHTIIKEAVVVDVKTPANRPDLNGLMAIAREVAAQAGNRLKLKSSQPNLALNPAVHFKNDVPKLAPRYMLAKIDLPKVLPSTPDFIKNRLLLSGQKSINLAVDITNYVMIQTGQPLHAFDKNKINGKVVIRQAKAGEVVETLDGTQRKLSTQDIVIADSRKVLGIAGVMGASNSEVSPATRGLYLESANFNGLSVRRSAQRHGLRTEASARFERSLPVQLAEAGMESAIELYKKHAKARVEWAEDELNIWPWVQHIGVKPESLSRLAGFNISPAQVVGALSKLGFEAETFDVVREAKKHLGKPYKWGANFKADSTNAFDCGYFVDYMFSLIGQMVGHTAPQIMDYGKPVSLKSLQPGDMLFRDGIWKKAKAEERKNVSHVAMYIGNGKIIHAENYHRVDGAWVELPAPEQKVRIDPLEIITKDPQFLGARRLVEDLGGWVAVTVPWWRPDVKTPEDVFEEVIKLIGFDKVGTTLPVWQASGFETDSQTSFYHELDSLLSGLGLDEVMTYPFTNHTQAKTFGFDISKHFKIQNPLTLEQTHLSSSLLPNLLSAVADNTRLSPEFGFFEVDSVFIKTSQNTESNRLGVIIQSAQPNYAEIKNVLDNLVDAYGFSVKLKPTSQHKFLKPARAAEVMIGSASVGYLGEVDAELTRQLKIQGCVAYLEINTKELYKNLQQKTYTHISKYQPISRDLTLETKKSVQWQDVYEALKKIELINVQYVNDYYQAGSRFLTLRVLIQPQGQEVTEDTVFAVLAQIESLLARKFGAKVK